MGAPNAIGAGMRRRRHDRAGRSIATAAAGGILGVSVLAGATAIAGAQPVDARFTDAEYAASGTFASFTVPPATITACTITNSLGVFQSVTLVWTSIYPASGVRLTLTQGATTAVVPASNVTTSGPSGGVYTHSGAHSGGSHELLTNLLGSTTTMTVSNLLVGTAWVSAGVSRQLSIGLAGLGATCT